MKANGAPEKIYIVIDPVWGSMSVNYNCNDTDNIEYTRTDAFIEKACSWLSNMPLEDMEYKYDDFDTSEGWYKMIEDFKKYMEK